MIIVKRLTNENNIRALSESEERLGSAIFTTNLSYMPGERILIVADARCMEQEAAIWFETAKMLPGHPTVEMLVFEGMQRSGEEPPAEIITACEQADITILHTIYSLTHTQAGKAVANHNHRGFSLPGVNYDLMKRTLGIDYSPIKQLGVRLKAALEASPILTITSTSGTMLTTHVRQDKVYADVGFVEHGEIGNLPAGEVFFAPLDGTTEGRWVVDGSMADFEETGLDEPIVIEIQAGRAVDIHGMSNDPLRGKSAKQLEEMLSAVGADAFHVAEIGIGINRSANPKGKLIEAEKAYATAHLALGNSSAIGGTVNVPIHLDGVSTEVTITGATTILTDGVFSI